MPQNHEVSYAILRKDVDDLRTDVKELTAATLELVEAWKAANKLVVFIKWLGGIGTTLAAMWLVIEHIWPFKR